MTVILRPSRPAITTPANGARFARGTQATFVWTGVPGVTQYFFEFTGAGRVLANPNGITIDAVNGFSGAGGGFTVVGAAFSVVIPPQFQRGTYQVRVIGLTQEGTFAGPFSDAVIVVVQ